MPKSPPAKYPSSKRTALLTLTRSDLDEMLGLPKGLRIREMDVGLDPWRLKVILESDDLPEVSIDVESPVMTVVLERRDEGRKVIRIDWGSTMELFTQRKGKRLAELDG